MLFRSRFSVRSLSLMALALAAPCALAPSLHAQAGSSPAAKAAETSASGVASQASQAKGSTVSPGELSSMAFRDPSLPVEQRVEDLISRLTLEEKVSQTMMASAAIPRLGIPRYDWWNEALHGVARNGVATVFPQAITLAATWDPALHQRVADVISTEARAKNNEMLAKGDGSSPRYAGLTIWSPNINIFRDPRWGRGQETYGEDPYLTSRFAVAFVRGLQGDDPRYLKTVATVKHFAVHSGPEPLRHGFNAVVSDRDLRETYLPAFEAGIVEGQAASLMSAYNAVDGVPAPANEMLLSKILRGEWGFKGAVVGDVDNVSDMWRKGGHAYSPDAADASGRALHTGNDLCSGMTYEALPEAIKRGLVTEAELDRALRRLFTLRMRLGQFDPAERVPYRSIPASANDSASNDAVALQAARESLVLLKNDGTLPWSAKDLKTVAILGPTADESSVILGNYSGTPSRKVTLASGLRSKLESKGVRVLPEAGVPLVKGFRVSGKPFPAGVLFTDASHGQGGLKAEVFQGNFKDTKTAVLGGQGLGERSDAQVDLQWDEAQPIQGIPINKAMLRWTGVLVAPSDGEYTLGVVAEGGVRLFIDDKAVIDSWRKDPERPISGLVTLKAGQSYAVRLEYAQMTAKGRIQLGWIAPGADDQWQRALEAARAADHIVLSLGLTPDLEGESMSVTAEGFNGGDRLNLGLPATQVQLLEAVAALHKPTVVVLTTGSALTFDQEKANAVLLAWYFGQRGAEAVAETLLGESNPAGRLPITFYQSEKDLPPFEDYSMANRTYRYFAGKPLYAFGHGLSYTTFAYTALRLSATSLTAKQTLTASVEVKNTGSREGDEVVQFYVAETKATKPVPRQQLVAFERVHLKAGESRRVEVSVPVERLRRWDDSAQHYGVDLGQYELRASRASDEAQVSSLFEVVSAK